MNLKIILHEQYNEIIWLIFWPKHISDGGLKGHKIYLCGNDLPSRKFSAMASFSSSSLSSISSSSLSVSLVILFPSLSYYFLSFSLFPFVLSNFFFLSLSFYSFSFRDFFPLFSFVTFLSHLPPENYLSSSSPCFPGNRFFCLNIEFYILMAVFILIQIDNCLLLKGFCTFFR